MCLGLLRGLFIIYDNLNKRKMILSLVLVEVFEFLEGSWRIYCAIRNYFIIFVYLFYRVINIVEEYLLFFIWKVDLW